MQSLSNLCYRQMTYTIGRAERKGSAGYIRNVGQFKGIVSVSALHEQLRCR